MHRPSNFCRDTQPFWKLVCKARVAAVGFEPTQLALAELESNPLPAGHGSGNSSLPERVGSSGVPRGIVEDTGLNCTCLG